MPLVANSQGKVVGTFNIPGNVPVGIRPVTALGNGGTKASTRFIGQGVIGSHDLNQSVNEYEGVDPVAQTFVLDQSRILTDVDFIFTNLGTEENSKPVRVEIREVENGVPSGKVLGTGDIPYGSIYVRPTPGNSPGLLTQAGFNLYTGPSISYGAATRDRVQVYDTGGYGGPARSFVQFNLPVLAGATITSAFFSLNKFNGLGNDIFEVTVSRAGTLPWSVTEHSWDHWPSAAAQFVSHASDPKFTYPSINGFWHDFDVTHIVQAWADGAPNNGLCVRATSEHFGFYTGPQGALEFYTGWTGGGYTQDAYKPRLQIEWVRNPISGPAVDGRWSRCSLDAPTYLEAGRPYAIVVMTDDDEHQLGIATVGQVVTPGNGTAGSITSEPYTGGRLMSSSNALSWTVYPNSDLAFRLVAARFTSVSRDVNLGDFQADNLTDFIVQATAFRPEEGTTVRFKVTRLSNGDVFYVNEGEAYKMSARMVNESFNVVAELRGTTTMSPILFPGTAMAVGNMIDSGSYVTSNIEAADIFNVNVNVEVYTPGSSSIAVYVESHQRISDVDQYDGSGNPITEWLLVSPDSGSPARAVGNGVFERVYKRTAVRGVGGLRTTRVKVIASGSPAARPFVDSVAVFTKLP